MSGETGRTTGRDERFSYISTRISKQGFVNVDELAEQLDVSRMTIHRDLDALQDRGVLRKTRGGATVQRSTQFESELAFRSTVAIPEKRKIARAAAELINDFDVVVIDDSTSSLELLPYVQKFQGLTVITNYLNVIERLESVPGLNLISLGGQYVAKYRTFMGIVAEDNLKTLCADTVFLSTSSIKGVSLFHQDQRLATLKRAMLMSAEQRVLLMDHTKIGMPALHRVCGLDSFTHLVVDDAIDDKFVNRAEREGVTVIVAG